MADLDLLTKLKRLDGSLLLVFRELVRQRRTTAASERLGLSQSAVSHSLNRLRELFDDPLFIRKPNGLEPTRRALELAPMIDEIIRLAQESMGLGNHFDPATTRRHFSLGAADFTCTLIAPPLLQTFERHAPSARFSCRFVLGEAALDALQRDEIDIAIGRFPPIPEGMRAETLFEEQYCVVARIGHPRIQGTIDLTTYAELGHVLVSASANYVDVSEDELQSAGISRRSVASVPRFLIAFTMVASSDAIATVPRLLAERYGKLFGLQVLANPSALQPYSILAVCCAGPTVDPGVNWLMGCLRASYGR